MLLLLVVVVIEGGEEDEEVSFNFICLPPLNVNNVSLLGNDDDSSFSLLINNNGANRATCLPLTGSSCPMQKETDFRNDDDMLLLELERERER